MDASHVQLAAQLPSIDWWAGTAGAILGAIVGAIIGSCVPMVWALNARRRERCGEVDAMHIELFATKDALDELRKANVLAPLYHLPITISAQALPKLIGDGVLSFNEVGALVQYVNRVEELNRGLERARDAVPSGDRVLVEHEYSRNCEKAKELLEVSLVRLGNMTLYEAVEEVLFRLEDTCKPAWWVFWKRRKERPD